MKKLIAMIGAVATAFGLYAASSTNISFQTSFETADLKNGILNGFDGVDGDLSKANTNQYAVGEAYAYNETATVAGNVRRTEFTDGLAQDNYLKLETGTNVLTREIATTDVFADQLVKFTGFEEPQTNIAGKVAVWMTAIEQEGTPGVPAVGEPEIDNGEGQMIPNPDYVAPVAASSDYVAADTNLYVTAATIASNGEATETVFAVDATGFKPEQWYRVTIQKIDNIFANDTQTMDPRFGFVVYVDGVAMTSEAAKNACAASLQNAMTDDAKALMAEGKLFPAITEGDTLATVGYQGIGAIDDLTLDNLGPEFARTIDVTFDPIANAKITKVVDSKGRTVEGADIKTYTAAAGVTLTVTVTADLGYFFVKNGVKSTSLDFDNITPAAVVTIDMTDVKTEKAVAKIDDELFGSLEETLVAIKVLEQTEDEIEVEILGECEYVDEDAGVLLSFADEATVTIAKGGIWVVDGDVNFVGDIGSEGLAKDVDVSGKLFFSGIVKAGSTVKAETMVTTEQDTEIVIEAGAKVVTKTDITSILDDVEKYDSNTDADDWTTWTVKGAPQETGFAIIIAGEPAVTNYYNTLQDAVDAATAQNFTITILNNETIDKTTINNKKIVITADKAVTLDAGSARCLQVLNNADVTIGENVTFTTTAHPSILVTGDAGDGKGTDADGIKTKLVINGTVLNTNPTFDATFTIQGNGNDPDGVDMTIGEDGLVQNANGAAIYWPNPGTLTVNGSVIGYTAILIKDGELVVNDGAWIEANGETYTALPLNRDGAFPTADAIAAGYYPLTMGYGVPKITVNGGTIKCVAEGATSIQGYDHESTTAPADAKSNIAVSGGNFFAGLLVADYLAEGFELGAINPSSNFASVAQSVKEPVANVTIGGVTTPYTDLHEALVAGSAKDSVVELIADVDLKDEKNWVPVANFAGTFDGMGYKISSLTITAESGNNIALIGSWTGAATMRNIIIENVDIAAPNSEKVAALVGGGADTGAAVISNITICGTVKIDGKKYVGGVIGHKGYHRVAKDLHVNGTEGSFIGNANATQVGGIAGTSGEGDYRIIDSSVSGVTIVASKQAGGIQGRLFTGNKVIGCSTENVTLSVTEAPFGSIVGHAQNSGSTRYILNYETDDMVNPVIGATEALPANNTVIGTGFEGEFGSFTAGTFTADATALADVTKQVAKGYAPVDNGDGTYTIQEIKVTSITLDVTEKTLAPEETLELTATVEPADALNKDIAWTTSDDAVATVVGGVVTAVAEGTATITATNAASGVFATCTVTVKSAIQPLDPEAPKHYDSKAEAEAAAASMTNADGTVKIEAIKIPAAVKDQAAYAALFTVKIDANNDLVIDFTAAAEAEIKEELADEDTSTSLLNPEEGKVTITAKPGLFYGVKAVGDVSAIGTAEGQNWVQATGATVEVVRPPVSGNAAFFQAVCTPKNPQSND